MSIFSFSDPFPVITVPSGKTAESLQEDEAVNRDIAIFAVTAYKYEPVNEKANISLEIIAGEVTPTSNMHSGLH